MQLYIAEKTCSLAVQIAAHEIGLPLDIIHVDMRSKTTSRGESYLDVNPLGYVPALACHNGEALTETMAILMYLADSKPEARLIPSPASFKRAKFHELMAFIATELHQKFIPLGRASVSEAAKDEFRADILRHLAALDRRLSDGRPWLNGDAFTIADAYLYTVLLWCPRRGVETADLRWLSAYAARAAKRPSIVTALAEEAAIARRHRQQDARIA